MASKNNAVENFEEWRKSKKEADAPVPEARQEAVETAHDAPLDKPTTSFITTLLAFFSRAVATLGAVAKSLVAKIKLAFASREKYVKAEAKPKSVDADSRGFLAALRAQYSNATPRTKKITLASVIGGAALIIVIVLLAKFEFVTPDAGIKTSLGSAKGHAVLIEKGAAIAPNDLIVAVQPGSPEDAPELIIGTVFSSNEETYALYDGEVIWQIPVTDLKGKVLFATATQKLP